MNTISNRNNIFIYIVLDGCHEKAPESKLQTLLRWAWYLISFPIFPYFWAKDWNEDWKKRRLDSWKYPKDPKFLVVNYVLSIILPVVDCITDFVAGVSYLTKKPKEIFF